MFKRPGISPILSILTALVLAVMACSVGGVPSPTAAGGGVPSPTATGGPTAIDITGSWNGQFLDLAGGIQRIATLSLERGEGEAVTGSIAFNTLDAVMPEFYAISGTYDGTTLRVRSGQGHSFWGAFSRDTWNGYGAWDCYDCPDQAWAQLTLQRGIHVTPVDTSGAAVAMPGDPAAIDSQVYDAFADPALPYVTYGDSYGRNLYERPFDVKMQYRPDLDVDWAFLSYSADWMYVSILLRGDNPATNGKDSDYAVEFDLNRDGRGDTLVYAIPPYTTTWTKTNVSVYLDTDGDVGGPNPLLTDAPWIRDGNYAGDGYENAVFSMGTGAIPNGTWARLAPQDNAYIQIAFRPAYINYATIFLWGVWADGGLRNPFLFEYNDAFTRTEAGSPLKGDANYPLNLLYLLDNTCRVAFGFTPVGNEPGLCTSAEATPGGGQPGGSQGGSPAPPSGSPTPPSGVVLLVQATETPAAEAGPTKAPPENGAIRGFVWDDANNDGVWRSDMELPWSLDPVVLRDPTCTITYATVLPDSTGGYAFTDLTPGDYCVQLLTLQPGPACPQSQNVSVPSGSFVAPVFCVHTESAPPQITDTPPAPVIDMVKIGGLVWSDTNVNGSMDPEESGWAGESVVLKADSCSGSTVATAASGADGTFGFPEQPPGTYCIAYNGSFSTSTPREVTVTLASGDGTSVSFGIYIP